RRRDWLAPGDRPGPHALRRLRLPLAVRQRRAQVLAGPDAELSEQLAQVPLDCPWAQEQLGADLLVRQPVDRQARDLHLLRGQCVARLDRALADGFSGGLQLPAGAVGVRLVGHAGERLVRDAQLVARVDPAVLAAQPLAVDEVRTRQRDADPGTP